MELRTTATKEKNGNLMNKGMELETPTTREYNSKPPEQAKEPESQEKRVETTNSLNKW